MSFELIYTSAPRGLRPGSKGFCTVAQTEGMPQQLTERLESLSGYRPVFPLGDARQNNNPVNFSHLKTSIGGRSYSILSYIAFAGADYSQRSNKFAHHVVLGLDELRQAGPAWVLEQSGVTKRSWQGEPALLPKPKPIPQGNRPAGVCDTWAGATGDAGWGGVLADAFARNQNQICYVIFEPGGDTDLLALFGESIALLPQHLRWQVTFSTYYTDLPAGFNCVWRAVALGTPAAEAALKGMSRSLVINLTTAIGAAAASEYVNAARSGQPIAAPEPTITTQQRPAVETPRYQPVQQEAVEQFNDEETGEYAMAGGPMSIDPGAAFGTPYPRGMRVPARKKSLWWVWLIVGGGLAVIAAVAIVVVVMTQNNASGPRKEVASTANATSTGPGEPKVAGNNTTQKVAETGKAPSETAPHDDTFVSQPLTPATTTSTATINPTTTNIAATIPVTQPDKRAETKPVAPPTTVAGSDPVTQPKVTDNPKVETPVEKIDVWLTKDPSEGELGKWKNDFVNLPGVEKTGRIDVRFWDNRPVQDIEGGQLILAQGASGSIKIMLKAPGDLSRIVEGKLLATIYPRDGKIEIAWQTAEQKPNREVREALRSAAIDYIDPNPQNSRIYVSSGRRETQPIVVLKGDKQRINAKLSGKGLTMRMEPGAGKWRQLDFKNDELRLEHPDAPKMTFSIKLEYDGKTSALITSNLPKRIQDEGVATELKRKDFDAGKKRVEDAIRDVDEKLRHAKKDEEKAKLNQNKQALEAQKAELDAKIKPLDDDLKQKLEQLRSAGKFGIELVYPNGAIAQYLNCP